MEVSNILNVAGFGVGIVGLALAIFQTRVAIYQTRAAHKAQAEARTAKALTEEKCSTRCKDLVELVRTLSEEAGNACTVANRFLVGALEGSTNAPSLARPIATVTANLDGVMAITRQLARFCERLNEEHEKEFGQPVFALSDAGFKRLSCLAYSELPIVQGSNDSTSVLGAAEGHQVPS